MRADAVTPGADTLIILPVRDTVLFPGTVFPIALGRASARSRPSSRPCARSARWAC